MVILGIDPGTAITGFGLLRVENGRKTVMDYGTLETCKGTSDAIRLRGLTSEAPRGRAACLQNAETPLAP